MQSQNLTIALIGNNTQNDTVNLLNVLATYQTSLSDNGWSAYNFFYTTRILLTYHNPTSNVAAAKAQIKPIVDYVLAHPDKYSIQVNKFSTFANLQAFVDGVLAPGAYLTSVASAQRLSGRLIPRSLFANASSRATLANAVQQGQTLNNMQSPLGDIGLSFQIYATSPKYGLPATGVNPAYRSSLWEVVYSQAWVLGVPAAVKDAQALAVHNAAGPLRALTPGGGCYYNEADVLEDDWQTAFFGTNYPQLLSIKNKYDPHNIWNVWKGVGWNGQSDPAYTCYNSA